MSTRQGEVIRIVMEQDDANGDTMARISAEWFGFDNAEANIKSMELVNVVAETADGWRVAKAGGEVKNPGAIR